VVRARSPTSATISAVRGPGTHGRDLTSERVGRVDAEGLLEAPSSRRGDDYGVAALHPLHPAEIEVALGDRGPYGTRDVWASLGPIEAESAKVSAGRTQCGKLDPELGEKTGACCRDLSGFVVERDVFAGDESIGEINAEAAGEVVVANSGRTKRTCLTDSGRYRGLFWRATATIPSIMSATVGDASRK